MKVHVTFTFYENPAAKQEIYFWETLVKHRLKEKYYDDDILSYVLGYGDDVELLVCIPIDYCETETPMAMQNEISHAYKLHSLEGDLTYLKTLIFGKVNPKQLDFLTTFIRQLETGEIYEKSIHHGE